MCSRTVLLAAAAVLEDERQVEQEPEADDKADGAVQHHPSVDLSHTHLRREIVQSLARQT